MKKFECISGQSTEEDLTAIVHNRGFINTPLLHAIGDPERVNQLVAQKTALKRTGQPEEVAKLLLFLLSDMSSYITGSVMQPPFRRPQFLIGKDHSTNKSYNRLSI